MLLGFFMTNITSHYNHYQTKPEETISDKLALLSINKDSQTVPYTTLEKTEINAALNTIFDKGDMHGRQIHNIAKELSGRSIMTLVIRAHGSEDFIDLGKNNKYTINNVAAGDFALLDPKATIIFESCLVGCNLAKRVANIQSRHVFAFIKIP